MIFVSECILVTWLAAFFVQRQSGKVSNSQHGHVFVGTLQVSGQESCSRSRFEALNACEQFAQIRASGLERSSLVARLKDPEGLRPQ